MEILNANLNHFPGYLEPRAWINVWVGSVHWKKFSCATENFQEWDGVYNCEVEKNNRRKSFYKTGPARIRVLYSVPNFAYMRGRWRANAALMKSARCWQNEMLFDFEENLFSLPEDFCFTGSSGSDILFSR